MEVETYIDRVRRLADANRSALGFLPASAYHEAAMKGNLWIATEPNTQTLMGYLLFGGVYPHLKVFQVYTCPEFRSDGMARTLMEELRKYGEDLNYLTITARVAAELEANKFWKDIGFGIIRQVPGSAKTGRTINIYMLELDVPSLIREDRVSFSSSAENVRQITYPSRPILQTNSYVIDLNVFLDVVKKRGAGESAHILSSAFSNEIKLAVTSEFTKELERHSHNFENDPVLEFSKKLPTLPEIEEDILTSLIEKIRNILSPNSTNTGRRPANVVSDLIHLASCIHHRAYGFITRDAAILQRAAQLYEKFDLRIISPADICDSYEDAATPSVPIKVAIGQQEVSVSELDERDRAEAEKFLDEMGIATDNISPCLAPGTTHSSRVRLVVRAENEIIGIGSWSRSRGLGQDTAVYLYINEDHADSDSAINHLLESSVTVESYGQLSCLDLKIDPRQIKTREVAISRGFHPLKLQGGNISRELRKASWKGIVTRDSWISLRNGLRETTGLKLPGNMPRYEELTNTGILLNEEASGKKLIISLFDFETLISPGVLICPGRPAVMIPIREEYASNLFPSIMSQPSFLPGQEAALRLERAYFSGTGRYSLLTPGKIVVFYVSHGQMEAVAVARITFSDKLTRTQAVLNLGRQGVLTEDEIHQRANRKGEVTAFTFDNVIVFPTYIRYRELKRMGCIGGANLVTAQKLSHKSLLKIIERAFESNH